MKTGVIILAAGESKRMGRPKQLLPIFETTLLEHVINQTYEHDFTTRVLVLGAYASLIAQQIDSKSFSVVENTEWKNGMGASVNCGLRQALSLYPNLDCILYLVVDQPLLNPQHIDRLLSRHIEKGSLITASKYNQTTGVPAVFSSHCFSELLTLSGADGAKTIMKKHGSEISTVTFEHGSFDIDSPEDYNELKSRYNLT